MLGWRRRGRLSSGSSASSHWTRFSRSWPTWWGCDGMNEPPRRDAGPLLALRGVTLAFGPKVIQHDLSFDVRRGSIFAVMGGSGCGKSTVLKSMVGLLRPTAGTIHVAKEDYWGATSARRTAIGRRFGVLFQSGA